MRKLKYYGYIYNNMVNKITSWNYLEPLLFKDWVHLSEISKAMEKNHSVVRQHLNEFEKRGILERKNLGKMTFYKIKKNPLLIDVISLVEKSKLIKQSDDLHIKEVVDFLHNTLSEDNKAAIFGSSVKDAKKAGDIDILLIGKINFDIKQLERNINKKVHLINVKKLEDVSPALKEEIKSKHLIVQGCEEIIKWLI